MRKWMIITGGALFILIGIVILALLNLNTLINSNKEYLLTQVEQGLGRKVSVGEVEVNVWGGVGMRLKDFALADDPAFSSEPSLRAADLQVNMKFFPLLWRELEVKRLILHKPVISVILNKEGKLNFASLGQSGAEKKEESPPTQETAPSSTSELAFLVSLVNVDGGEVRYVDQKEGTELRIRRIDLKLTDLSVDQPISLQLAAAIFAEQQNFEIAGEMGPLGPALDVSNVPVKGEVKIESLDIETLRQALPQLKNTLQNMGPSRLQQATIAVSGSTAALTLSKVEIAAAILAERQNLEIKGRAGPLGPGFDTSDVPVEGEIEITALNIAALQKAFPQLKNSLPQGLDLSGPLQATVVASGRTTAINLSKIEIAAAVFAADKPNLKLTKGRFGPVGKNVQDASLSGDLEVSSVELARLRRFAPLAGSLPPDLSAEGPLSLDAHVEGTIDNLAVSGTLESTGSTISLGDRFRKPQGIPLRLSTDARVTKKAVALQKTKIQLHTLELTGSGEMGLGKVPSLRLTLDSNRAALAGWEKIIPSLPISDLSGNLEVHTRIQGEMGNGKLPKIDGSLNLASVNATLPSVSKPLSDLNAKVTFTGERAELTETAVHLGDSQIRLAAKVEKFSPLTLTYYLSAPELRLADLQAQPDGANGKNPEVLKEVKSEGRVGMNNGSLSYQGKLSSSQGMVSQMSYADLQAVFSLVNQVVTIESFKTQAFGGAVQANGRYDMQAASPRFTFASQVQNLDLAQVFNSEFITAPQVVQGRFNFDLQLNGSGKQWAEIQQTLQGQGRAEVVDGMLRDINIAEDVLSGVTGIPGLSMLISPRVRERYPKLFATGDTNFDQLGGLVTIGGGKVQTDDLVIAAADWRAQGKGWFSFDRTLDFRALLIMSQQLSDDIVEEVKQAKYIVNEQGRLEVPFALSGTLPGAKPKPDVEYVGELIKRAALRKGTEELQERVLDKFLPRRERPQVEDQPVEPEQQTEGESIEPEQPKKDLKDELLRKGLEGLFRR